MKLATAAASAQTAFPRSVHWQPLALAQGEVGLALACAYLDACFPGEGWDRAGHANLTVAGEAVERFDYVPIDLFSGLAGFGFAAACLARGSARYQKLLATVNAALLERLLARTGGARVSQEADGLAFGEFDLISGLSGVGAYLLCMRGIPSADRAMEALLGFLVSLTGGSARRPRWWTPSSLLGDEQAAVLYPNGSLNCGLAHGIPGPLSCMSLALSSGITVPGMNEAIEESAEWLVAYRVEDASGVNWPYAVSLTDAGLPEEPESTRAGARAAWCYGAPGVARALWLAGVAMDRPDWRQLATDAMAAVYRRPMSERQIDSPTFCHGVAGLLQITLRFANDTSLPMFSEAAADLTEWLLSAYEPESLLGYRNWEPGGTRIDQPGLLEGAPGVLLTLLAAATDIEPSWDRAFLLA